MATADLESGRLKKTMMEACLIRKKGHPLHVDSKPWPPVIRVIRPCSLTPPPWLHRMKDWEAILVGTGATPAGRLCITSGVSTLKVQCVK